MEGLKKWDNIHKFVSIATVNAADCGPMFQATTVTKRLKNFIMTTKNSNGWIDKPLDGFYAHIYSNGHSVKNLFETEEDRIFGMNLLPIAAHACGVRLLMIQVMGTHFHEIACGRPEDCERMRRFIKRQLEIRMKKTGRKEYIPKGIDISIDGIETETELKNKIVYVYRNSIAAGFPQAPWHYRWGPGDILFVDHHVAGSRVTSIGSLSVRQRKAMLRTKVQLPSDWRYDDSGMIIPHSYLDWELVERLFVSIRAFIAFLHQKKDIEAQIDQESANVLLQDKSDKALRDEARELCRTLFERNSVSKASAGERMAVAQKLWGDRRTYSIPQLARVTLLDKELLIQVFGRQSHG